MLHPPQPLRPRRKPRPLQPRNYPRLLQKADALNRTVSKAADFHICRVRRPYQAPHSLLRPILLTSGRLMKVSSINSMNDFSGWLSWRER